MRFYTSIWYDVFFILTIWLPMGLMIWGVVIVWFKYMWDTWFK